MARMTSGIDIFQCVCGEYVIMGRKCPACGKTNADALEEKAKAEQPEKPKKRQPKFCEPSSKGTFIESFLFKKPKK